MTQLGSLVKQNEDYKELKQEGEYVFSSGIGINPEDGVPIRYLSYLLPVLKATSEFKESVGQIYFADKAGLDLGIPSKIITENVKQYKELTNGFLEEFYPSISEKIFLTDEKDFQVNPKLEEQNMLVQKMIKKIIEQNNSQINTFAEKRGDKALEYMVKHSLYMRDPVTENKDLFLIDNPKGFENSDVVMIGGPAEKIFYKVRQILVNSFGKPNGNLQLFTDIGRLPPYYSKFMEKIFGENILEESVIKYLESINRELKYDYIMLLISCSSSQDYSIIKRRKNFNKDDFELLQEGFENLKIFLKQF